MSKMRELWSEPRFLQAIQKKTVDDAPLQPSKVSADSSGPEPGGPAEGDSAAGGTAALDATSSVLFFAKASAELTAKDKAALDRYAAAYRAGKISEPITVDGYASMEGNKKFNEDLAKKRADAVADYLKKNGVPNVGATGNGPTDLFSKDDLRQNRRAALTPPPPSSGSLSMRDPKPIGGKDKKPNLMPTDEPDGYKPPVNPTPKAPAMVPRSVYDPALKKFLEDLGKSQGRKDKSVISTDKAWQADAKLHAGYSQGSPYTKKGATVALGNAVPADQLAKNITKDLPDEIPKKNFDDFQKLYPVETPAEEALLDKAKKKLDKKADEVLRDFKVPEKYWKDVKDAVTKHMPDLLDKLPVDNTVKDMLKKAYDEINKSKDDK